jgi:hypothetical protein
MPRMRALVWRVVLAMGVLIGGVGHAFAQGGGSGQIGGTVSTGQGEVVPGVTVTLRNQQSGVTRVVVSEQDGQYRFLALPPGVYTVRAELQGFTTEEAHDVTITIGLEVKQDFALKVDSVKETVTVTGAQPVVDTSKAEVSSVVTQQQMETLPINSRNYLSLALLVPGTTVDGTRQFFSTVNVGGSATFNGTGNVVDGMINNWAEDGEPRQDLPEEAVEEFKVTNAGSKAEFGLSTGGVVQTVTKSGTNLFRGTAFEYFRDKSLNAKGVFETVKPAYRRHQFGGSIGGPVVENKIHFFGSFERTDTSEFYTVLTGQPQYYSALEGTFPLPSSRNLYSGRADIQMSNSQSAFARVLGETDLKTCQGCGGTSASGHDESIPRISIVGGHTWIRGGTSLNDFRFQYAHAAFYGYPTGSDVWTATGEFPAERLSRSTRQYTFPSFSYGNSYDYTSPESRWEIRDTYSLNRGKHSIKIGGEYNYMPYVSDGAGNQANVGTYSFSKDQVFNPNDPATIAALTGASTFSASTPPIATSHPSQYYVGFVQDDWKFKPNFTLNLGLRYERMYGTANEDLDPNDFPVTLPYVDVSQRGDKNNFGPRIGGVWDVLGNGNTVVRAGYGLYYGHIRMLGTLPEFQNFKTFSIAIPNPTYPDPYGGKDPATFITASPTPNITVVSNHMIQPTTNQVSGGVSQALGKDFALHVDAVWSHSLGDYKVLNINAKDPVTGLTPLTAFGRVDQVRPDSDLRYKAVYTKLERRFRARSQFFVSYTFTSASDNNPMARYRDPFDPSIEFGPSNFERRHALVASGSIVLPLDITVGVLWTVRSELPWTPTAGVDINKDGFNTDLVPGTTRNDGSRNLDLAAINAWRALNGRGAIPASQVDSSFINNADVRASKAIRFAGDRKIEFLVQAFNLFNTENLQGQFGTGRVTNALSDSFGRILSARPNRQVELVIKTAF